MSNLLIIILVLVVVIAVSCATLNVPTYQGEKTDHFDGKKFHDPDGRGLGDFGKLMKYNRQNKKAKWEFQETSDFSLEQIDNFTTEGKVRYFHINHATVLMQMDGMNILTDPVYSKRASPISWAGPKRFRDPGIPFDKLPKIDAVLISHDHYDHLDISTLKKLRDRDNPTILAGLGLKGFLRKFKLENVVELDWNEETEINGLTFTFTQAIHWSNRAFSPRKTLWGGYVIKGSSSIFFAGDTAYGPHFTDIKEKYGPFDLALIPVGAYTPRFFMLQVHMDPQQAFQTHMDVDAKESYAIHWGTFQLTHEGMYDPVDELTVACDSAGVDNFYFDRLAGGARITGEVKE
ncbi:MBL fold metallo-hydrolase [Portibacter lacus]|uniref:Membrane protein n=1 Tax=Portibacter lacus TaxID=1099794 RepID=A0AA37WBA7_9BACT|nr:MBL fold metallo-hydrolase [Portibacter lacus]GLR15431.1 membrane protein [Portibacter lacus]